MKYTTLVVLLLAAAACGEKPAATADAQPATSKPTNPTSGPGIDAPQTGLAQGKLVFEGERGDVPIDVEIAQTTEQRRIGMMFRNSAADGTGMIFLMPREEPHQFWMRNTLIPLDMVFVNGRMEVVGVLSDVQPLTLEGRGVPRPSRFVVELPGGYAARVGITVGSKMRAEGIPGI